MIGVRTVAATDLRELTNRAMAAGRAAGLDAIGVAKAEPFTATRRLLEERKAAGLHAGMHFTFGNPARSTDPTRTLPGARALVVGARSYLCDEPGDGDHDADGDARDRP